MDVCFCVAVVVVRGRSSFLSLACLASHSIIYTVSDLSPLHAIYPYKSNIAQNYPFSVTTPMHTFALSYLSLYTEISILGREVVYSGYSNRSELQFHIFQSFKFFCFSFFYARGRRLPGLLECGNYVIEWIERGRPICLLVIIL